MATQFITLPLSVNEQGLYWGTPVDIVEADWEDYYAEPHRVKVHGEVRREGRIPLLHLQITAPASHLRWMNRRESGDGTGRSLLECIVEGAGEVSGRDVDALHAELELMLVDAARGVAEREAALV